MHLDEKRHAIAVYVWLITLAVFFNIMPGKISMADPSNRAVRSERDRDNHANGD